MINMKRLVRALTLGGAATAFTLTAAGAAIADSSTFSVHGQEAQPDETSWAQCPAGSHLIGGGYTGEQAFANGGSLYDAIEANGPSISHPGAWAASAHRTPIYALALCQKDS